MKKSLVFLFFLLFPSFLFAQERVKRKEVGIVLRGITDFGLTFRIGNNKSLWRFSALYVSGGNVFIKSNAREAKGRNIGFAVQIGKEYRKILVNKLEFRYGADLSLGYNTSKLYGIAKKPTVDEYRSNTKTFNPAIYFLFGLNYVIKEKIVLGAIFSPYFGYQIGEMVETDVLSSTPAEVKSDISGFNFGVSSSSLLLSVVYRF